MTPLAPGQATHGGAPVSRGAGAAELCELPALVDISTIAHALGITVRHVRRLVTERRIPFVKVGYFVRFDPSAIAGWVDAHRVEVADRSVRGYSR